jgi:DNA-binding response OmpR family regulator
MAHHTTLLVADGEAGLRARLTGQFEADELPCREADSLAGARAALETGSVGLALLGPLDRPAAAVRIVRALRGGELRCDPGLPMIVLGQTGGELELLRAFEAGCDDFVSRDVGYLELRARVRACMSRTSERARPGRRQVGSLVIDHATRRASLAGRAVPLTAMEFALLDRLARDPERVFTKHELLRDVWGYRSPGRTRTLDAHACRLRRRLEAAGGGGLVVNLRGVGYRLGDGRAPTPPAPSESAAPAAA